MLFSLFKAHPLITFESNCDCLKDRKIAVKYGQNFTLSCKVDYASPPPTFTWFKDGKNDSNNVPVVAAGTRLTVQHVPPAESQLTFTEIMLEDAGVYYCKANNTLMKDIQSVNVQVECKMGAIIYSQTCYCGHSEIRTPL